MPTDVWRLTTLSNVVSLQRGHDLPEPERTAGDVPVMGSFGLTGWHDTVKCRGPGVTVGRSGASFGVVSYVDRDFWPLNTALYVTDFHGNDERFVYYLLKTIDFTAYNTGSAQPSLNRNHLVNIAVNLPELAEQRAIVNALGSLDDKIEQNRRTGRALEGLARATFKAWFVDFEPVKAKAAGQTSFPGMPPAAFAALPDRFTDSPLGSVPLGWECKSLYSVAKFINGAAFKSSHFCESASGLPVVKIAELKSGITDQTKFSNRTDLDAKYYIDTGEMLYSWSGSPDTSLDTFLWTKGPGLLNQHIFRIVTESDAHKVCVYYLLKHLKQDLIEIARDKQTTGLGHVTVGDMQRLMVVWPEAQALDAFYGVIGPLFASVFNGMLESEKLAALRDYLLPRLLSGRVRVRDAERDVEAL